MSVRLAVQQSEFTLDVDGVKYRVEVRVDGRYGDTGILATKVGQREVTGDGGAKLREKIDLALAEQASNASRRSQTVRRRKAAPQPALRFNRHDGQLTRITVRGVHATTGKVLITEASGTKRDVSQSSVLRVLTDDEIQRLQEAIDVEQVAREAVIVPTRWFEAEDRLRRQDPLPASYDPSTDRWSTEWKGTRFAARSSRELRVVVTRRVVTEEYPWTVASGDDDEDRVIETVGDEHWGTGDLFRTREDAEGWLVTAATAAAAESAKAKLLTEYAFDLTPYQPGGA